MGFGYTGVSTPVIEGVEGGGPVLSRSVDLVGQG
jgi:hypothetical protein